MTSSLPDPRGLALHRDPALPVSVVTGFLGSGKTTLIRRLLAAAADTAVIVNEFGEVGLDHLLLECASDDVVLLPGGCLCCQARNDLVRALRTLLERRERRELPPYSRVVVETSGLADPAPILQTFLADPIRLSRHRLANLVAVIDAGAGARQLADFEVARLQLALADRVLLSKLDIAAPGAASRLEPVLRPLTAGRIEPAGEGAGLLHQLFSRDGPGVGMAAPLRSAAVHGERFVALCRRLAHPLSLPRIEEELHRLAALHGEDLLRLKGIVDVAEAATPFALHAVRHIVDRPRALTLRGPGPERAIVAIVPAAARTAVEPELDRMIERATPPSSRSFPAVQERA